MQFMWWASGYWIDEGCRQHQKIWDHISYILTWDQNEKAWSREMDDNQSPSFWWQFERSLPEDFHAPLIYLIRDSSSYREWPSPHYWPFCCSRGEPNFYIWRRGLRGGRGHFEGCRCSWGIWSQQILIKNIRSESVPSELMNGARVILTTIETSVPLPILCLPHLWRLQTLLSELLVKASGYEFLGPELAKEKHTEFKVYRSWACSDLRWELGRTHWSAQRDLRLQRWRKARLYTVALARRSL